MKFELNTVPKDLIKVKESNGLKVVKYQNKVFYNNLWNAHPLLKECRGLVLDQENNIVAHPFTKVFNIGENGTTFPKFPFSLVDKKNGFLGVLSRYDGEHLFSTTGSIDSEFVTMWKDMFMQNTDINSTDLHMLTNRVTLMFEVCHPNDPHIIKEEIGIYLIGARSKAGRMLLESELDAIASLFAWKRPKWRMVYNQEELDKLLSGCKHEGYMVRDFDGNIVAKAKSSHYLGMKFLARCSKNKADKLYNASVETLFSIGLEEEFVPVVEAIKSAYTQEEWLSMSEQNRLTFIVSYLDTKDKLSLLNANKSV